jgi:hypothetical protein
MMRPTIAAPTVRPARARVRRAAVLVVCALLAAMWPAGGVSGQSAVRPLPNRLSDREFWQLSTGLSEPDGRFQSDNLVSNERVFQHVVPALGGMRRGGVYLGVAPEQNFTYIAALEPRLAFIVDIRRGNLLLHLFYKSLFELSETRADFLSRLFSRRRPAGLKKDLGVRELFAAFAAAPPDEPLHRANVLAVERQLTRRHGFTLTPDDLKGLQYIHGMFFHFGPEITYASSSGRGGRGMPSFAELQQSVDADGRHRAFLASHAAYATVRALQEKNLIVPVVGDFAGSKALRGVGQYLAGRDATVTAFYTSNVEQYLFQNGVWSAFYQNLALLPLDDGSVIIRSPRGGSVIDPIQALLADVGDGKIRTYADITSRGTLR